MIKATFGAGCFWGVQSEFDALEGVVSSKVGYSGGEQDNPTYEDVCTGNTGHAEVLELDFDPEKITYVKLLDLFWKLHDPTQLNRQGPDIGTQYRSVIFYHDENQKVAAEASKAELESSGLYKKSIVTLIEPAVQFYEAEEYHQKYVQKGGRCSIT